MSRRHVSTLFLWAPLCLFAVAAGCGDATDGAGDGESFDDSDAPLSGSVTWMKPIAGAGLYGKSTLRVDTPESTSRVAFFLDGVRFATATSPEPNSTVFATSVFATQFDTSDYTLGGHTLAAKARAADGTTLSTSSIAVKLLNGFQKITASGSYCAGGFITGVTVSGDTVNLKTASFGCGSTLAIRLLGTALSTGDAFACQNGFVYDIEAQGNVLAVRVKRPATSTTAGCSGTMSIAVTGAGPIPDVPNTTTFPVCAGQAPVKTVTVSDGALTISTGDTLCPFSRKLSFSRPTTCFATSECASGQACSQGMCAKACSFASGCPAGLQCQSGACM